MQEVEQPKHYQLLGGVEAIDVIQSALTPDQFFGYCLGNMLKYKLRAGAKDATMVDLAKAEEYRKIFERFQARLNG